MAAKTKEAAAAVVTVYRVAEMTDKGRAEVCNWLRRLAGQLQREPEAFAKTFRARYLYKLAVLVLVFLFAVVGTRAVDPLSVTITNKVTDANGAQINPGTVYQGTTLILTNCVPLQADGVSTQDLTDVEVRVVYGNINVAVATNVATKSGNLYSTSLTVPSLSSFYVWTILNTNELIYPKRIIATEPMP